MAIVSVESKVFGASGRFDVIMVMDNGQTAATGDVIDVREAKGISLVVATGASVSAGTVVLEGSATAVNAGTWVSLGSITTNAASTTFKATYDNEAGPMPYVRARISLGLTGGTADVYVMVVK